METILSKRTVYIKNIYNFDVDHIVIGVISFVLEREVRVLRWRPIGPPVNIISFFTNILNIRESICSI